MRRWFGPSLPQRRTTDDVVTALRLAVEEQVVRSDVDLEVAADGIIGAILFRILARLDFPDDYVDALLAPLSAAPASH